MGQISIDEFCGERKVEIIDKLTAVWNISVRTSHHFLTEEDIKDIEPQVGAALRGIEHLVIVWDGSEPVGFMGVQEQKIEMLFLSISCIGKGIGKNLINLAISKYGAAYVDVNEQNAQAVGFYEHEGFAVVGRSALDGDGKAYPLLHMQLRSGAWDGECVRVS